MQFARQDLTVQSLDPKCSGPCIGDGDGGPTLELSGVASVGRKIPGGEQFKPMKASEFVLDRVRVETIGRLIFVALEDGAPPLHEFLGTVIWRRLEYTFGPAMPPVARWTVERATLRRG